MTGTKPARSDELALRITRILDAPRALVFEAWSDPRHVLHWMGPRDHPATHFESDRRAGGRWRGCLRAADGGRELWQGGVIREVVAPERLVMTFAWEDERGQSAPETVLAVTFAEEQGKTRMTLDQAPFASGAERDGHAQGWSSTFDRLDEYIGTLRRGA